MKRKYYRFTKSYMLHLEDTFTYDIPFRDLILIRRANKIFFKTIKNYVGVKGNHGLVISNKNKTS